LAQLIRVRLLISRPSRYDEGRQDGHCRKGEVPSSAPDYLHLGSSSSSDGGGSSGRSSANIAHCCCYSLALSFDLSAALHFTITQTTTRQAPALNITSPFSLTAATTSLNST
jgi:hypothetical protein